MKEEGGEKCITGERCSSGKGWEGTGGTIVHNEGVFTRNNLSLPKDLGQSIVG